MRNRMKIAALCMALSMASNGAATAQQVPRGSVEAMRETGFLGNTDLSIEACSGPVAVVRFSAPQEGGSLDGHRQAAMAHAAWAHSFGDTDLKVHRFIGAVDRSTLPTAKTADGAGDTPAETAADEAEAPASGAEAASDEARPGTVVFGTMLIYPSWARAIEIWSSRRGDTDRPGARETFIDLYRTHTTGYTGMTLCLEDMGLAATGI